MRILVVRTDRIGDVVLSTPVLSFLREQVPDCHLTMLVSPYSAKVVEGHPDLDELLIDTQEEWYKGLRGFLYLIRDLRSKCFDMVFILHATARLALACRIAGIPERVGSAYRWYGFLFNKKVYEHRRNSVKHEIEYNLGVVRTCFSDSSSPSPTIQIPIKAIQKVKILLNQWQKNPEKDLVLLHPGSGGSARNWPVQSYRELAGRLSDSGIQVIVTGSYEEKNIVDQVMPSRVNTISAVAGDVDVKELAALIQIATVCVTNSTGPLHIAATVGTPTVALFCPIKPCSPVRWGPYGNNHEVLMPDVPPCPRCIEDACQYFDCMKRISVQNVFEAIQRQLVARHLKTSKVSGGTLFCD
tara:strand:+ start:44522 stop:45589 length:1068 start_codon:yes stop_codon:yes gene_type:complete